MSESKPMAEAALAFASNCLCHNHQGIIDCGDKIVVYCNGVKHSPDALMSYLRDDLGLNESIELAVDEERLFCWAVVATNYQRKPVDCDGINEFLWSDLPGSEHDRQYKAVQFVPVATIPPHWENAYLAARAKAE